MVVRACCLNSDTCLLQTFVYGGRLYYQVDPHAQARLFDTTLSSTSALLQGIPHTFMEGTCTSHRSQGPGVSVCVPLCVQEPRLPPVCAETKVSSVFPGFQVTPGSEDLDGRCCLLRHPRVRGIPVFSCIQSPHLSRG